MPDLGGTAGPGDGPLPASEGVPEGEEEEDGEEEPPGNVLPHPTQNQCRMKGRGGG